MCQWSVAQSACVDGGNAKHMLVFFPEHPVDGRGRLAGPVLLGQGTTSKVQATSRKRSSRRRRKRKESHNHKPD